MMNVGLKRISIANLEPDLENIFIVGIIIAKQRPRKFADAKGKENGLFKAVWNFTLRDTQRDYINATFWGNDESIFQMSEKFHTADVVEVIRPRVDTRRINDYGEQFRPMVTSPYSLCLNEQSELLLFGGNTLGYIDLLKWPTKPLAGFVPLRDIHNSGASMKDEHVDILGAVRSVGTIRTITLKTGEDTQLREVILFDYTSPGLKLTIWETDVIARANSWRPRTTILFITDIKVEWSNFQRCYSGKLTIRSIVTENPIGQEAHDLEIYAKNAPLETSAILDQMVTSLSNPNAIQNVMNIKQVHDKVNTFIQENQSGDQQFTALLFAVVTQLDLDGLSPIVATKCSFCKSWLNTGGMCKNADCPVLQGIEDSKYDVSFDLKLMLTDHTGSLVGCRLSGQNAENVLNCTVQNFLEMNIKEKCNLKWKYLMKRCAIRIMVLLVNRRKPVVSIINCSLANQMELVQRLPIY